jgi:hypothetical protein
VQAKGLALRPRLYTAPYLANTRKERSTSPDDAGTVALCGHLLKWLVHMRFGTSELSRSCRVLPALPTRALYQMP